MNGLKIKLKKAAALLLSVLTAVSTTAINAAADGGSGSQKYHAGDIVSVDVCFGNINISGKSAKLAAFDYFVYYDPEVLTVASTEKEIDGHEIIDTEVPGEVGISAMAGTGFQKNFSSQPAVAAHIEFEVSKDSDSLGMSGDCKSISALDQTGITQKVIYDPDVEGMEDTFSSMSFDVTCPHESASGNTIYHEDDVVTVSFMIGGLRINGERAKLASVTADLYYDPSVVTITDGSQDTTGDMLDVIVREPGLIKISGLSELGFKTDFSVVQKPLVTRVMRVKKNTNDLGLSSKCYALGVVSNDGSDIISLIDGSNPDDKYTTLDIKVDCPHVQPESDSDTQGDKPTTDSEKPKPTTDSEKPKPTTDSEKPKPTNTDTSKKDTDTSKKNTDTSKKDTDTSKKNTDTTKKDTDTSKKNTDTTKKDTDTSKKNTDTTKKDTDTSKKNTDTTKKDTDTSKKNTDTTKKDTDTSKKNTDTTKKDTDTSKKSTDTSKPTANTDTSKPTPTPTTDTGADEPDTQTDVVDTATDEPGTQTDTADTESDEPDTQTDVVDTESDEPDTQTDIVDTESDEPDTQTDIVDTESDEPDTQTDVVDTESDVPDTPDVPDTESDKPDTETDKEKTPDVPDKPDDTDKEVESGDVVYKPISDDEVMITKVNSDEAVFTIPETVDGKKITAISADVFKDNPNIKAVVIGSGVSQIDKNAFAGCDGLLIYGEKGSYAEEYAAENSLDFVNMYNMYGDVDEDEAITSGDSLTILRTSINLGTFTKPQQIYADVNIDEIIDSSDALQVLRYSVTLPANENVGQPVKI